MISPDQIKTLSKRFAIDEYSIIREYIQLVFLGVLYSDRAGRKIYFKGGTAIHLLLKSGRFSEDLDFTAELTAPETEGVVNETIKKVILVIPNTTIKEIKKNIYSYSGILSHKSAQMKHPLNIRLDFSLREKPETRRETVLTTDFPTAPQPVIRHLDWPELLAEKIRALLYRAKGRDVYDLWFLLSQGIELDWPMINRKTKLYDIKTSLQGVLQRVTDFDEKVIKNDLGKFLPAHDRGFVAHLKTLTIQQLTARQSFTIVRSENLDYTKLPSGSFSGADKLLYNLKKTRITAIERQDENLLIVSLTAKNKDERTGHIRAKTRNGVRELNSIEKKISLFKDKSYDELINHGFTD